MSSSDTSDNSGVSRWLDSQVAAVKHFETKPEDLTSLLAMCAVASFSITEERAHEIRAELEQRRGAPAPEAATA